MHVVRSGGCCSYNRAGLHRHTLEACEACEASLSCEPGASCVAGSSYIRRILLRLFPDLHGTS